MDMLTNKIQITTPPVVTWRITSRCNNNCAYCYGPDTKTPEMNLDEISKMLKMLHERGVKVIDLTGGEPLMRKELEEIVEMMKGYGFEIFIDTNGDYFHKYRELIVKNFKGIGLTVDFPDKKQSYKIVGNLDRVLEALVYLNNKKNGPIIRVATVVTQDNCDKLEEIGNLLCKYKVDLWKLYQFIPQNEKALKNRRGLEISREKFLESTENLEKVFSGRLNVVVSKMEDRDSCYFFVGSDGKVFMPIQKKDIFEGVELGSVFDEDIFEKWKKFVSLSNFIENTEISKKFDFENKG